MLIITMVYGDFSDLRRRKNKPNSKPISSFRVLCRDQDKAI